uniref:Phage protein n=1 Tax=viral metagenome TaxID=1070528 RepID=A0A6M3ILL6_9ZZZZ
MGKFRKKPAVIDAVRFIGFTDGANYLPKDLIELFGIKTNESYPVTSNENGCLIIHTLEGDMKAELGDWIIKGIKGEFYPCKPDVFKQTYEEVKE